MERPAMEASEWKSLDLELSARAEQLYALYAWAVDYGDFELLESLTAPEITITRGDAEHPGIDSFLQVYRNNWEGDWSAAKHYIMNVIASRQADGLVRSRAYFQAMFIRSDHSTMVVGRYDDLLAEVDGQLKIQHKRIHVEGSIRLPESVREWGGYQLARVK